MNYFKMGFFLRMDLMTAVLTARTDTPGYMTKGIRRQTQCLGKGGSQRAIFAWYNGSFTRQEAATLWQHMLQ
jgi:hypothetical protein